MASFLLPLLGLLVLMTGILFLLGDPPWLGAEKSLGAVGFDQLVQSANQVKVSYVGTGARTSRPDCHLFNCLDVYKCSPHLTSMKVYIYPYTEYLNHEGDPLFPLSVEYYEMLEAVYNSHFYTSDPASACLFIPPVDTLNLKSEHLPFLARILAGLDYWDQGKNHLLFNILAPTVSFSSLPTDQAILASSSPHLTRQGFDLTLPVLPSPRQKLKSNPRARTFLLVAWPNSLESGLARSLSRADKKQVLLVDGNSRFPQILNQAQFCLFSPSSRSDSPPSLLTDCLRAGSIPVILSNSFPTNLPFSSLLDWSQFSISWRPRSSSTSLLNHLTSLSQARVKAMRKQMKRAFKAHFSSPGAVVLSSLEELNNRLLPSSLPGDPSAGRNPLFLPLQPPEDQGFTAVILTYDRVESLFQVVTKVSQAPSLARVVVVWNHQTVPPPPVEEWPRISKPLKVIQTSANHLSNRFQPYPEIETECILSLDDDISMLTSDELEFGYQVWREFPDRIVGFPSRTHQYDSDTDMFRYESEWTNDLSLVLTGVSFYHKYWHYLYTASPSLEAQKIKAWVDKHINCEDIAFNLMVANITGKAPIKVGPRKKFKCSTPSCENLGMLSNASGHLEERSDCLDLFLKIYREGGVDNPLLQVEFRADPVLYKENFPDRLKQYKDIGSL
jgi:glucuronyl/N-acetylglucosaminyl transferase EXT2